MKEAFGKMKVFPVATATKEGTPNVIPPGIAEHLRDDTLCFVDNFMTKTLSTFRVKPKIAFFIWGLISKAVTMSRVRPLSERAAGNSKSEGQ